MVLEGAVHHEELVCGCVEDERAVGETIVAKEAAIDEFIETLDQGKPKKARKRRVENLAADAFHAGAAAGSEVTINRPIEEEACQNS